MLNHVAGKGLAMVFIDNKVDANTPREAGTNLIATLERELLNRGHQGIVLIGGTISDIEFLKAAAQAAAQSPFRRQFYFGMDSFGKSNTSEALRSMAASVPTQNRIYGTGETSCSPRQFFSAIEAGVTQQAAGVHGLTYTWTLDSTNSMNAYIDYGVRAVITNFPGSLGDVIRSRGMAFASPSHRPPAATR
jgi:glycerophosphoryl diester phosphodiesterase